MRERRRGNDREKERTREKRLFRSRFADRNPRERGVGEGGERDIESVGKVTSVSVSFECVNSRFDDRILENKTGCCNARILFIFCILLYESIRFNTM